MKYLLETVSEKKRKSLIEKAIKQFTTELNKSDLTNKEKKCIRFVPINRILKSKDFFTKRAVYIGAYKFDDIDSNPYAELKDICKRVNDKNSDFTLLLNFKLDVISFVLIALFGPLGETIIDHSIRKKKLGVIQLNMKKSAIEEMYKEAYEGEKSQYEYLLEAYNALLNNK